MSRGLLAVNHMRNRRKSMGLSIRKVAQRADISPGYLHDLETGRRLPSIDAHPMTLYRMRRAK